MEILVLLFKSGLSFEQVAEMSKGREKKYRQVKGLLQKFYVKDPATGRVGGVFVFDTKQDLASFRDSDLAKSTKEAYLFTEPPEMKVLEVAKTLYEDR